MKAVRAWAHLLLGGALMTPYVLLSGVLLAVVYDDLSPTDVRWQAAAYGLSLPMVAVTGLLAPARPLSTNATQTLLGVPPDRLAAGPSGSWPARRRTAGWLVLHTGLGAVLSGLSLSVPPAVLVLLARPLWSPSTNEDWPWVKAVEPAPWWLAPVGGLVLLTGLVALVILTGKLLRRCAPVLLGPTPADRLVAAERRAARLAESNRVARELHDSIGHALSAVTLQAAAARRVLDSDPDFARGALAAVEETSRRAVEELDSVLGVLRQGEDALSPTVPGLGELDSLLRSTRAAGVNVSLRADAGLETLPKPVSQEAYRIVQEGLSNVLRHAGPAPAELVLTLSEHELTIVLQNDAPPSVSPGHPAGGRGLAGIVERATLLGGSATAGRLGTRWRLHARLPARGGR